MNSKKNIFALLGGIFLMVAGTILLINNAISIIRGISYYSNPLNLLTASVNIHVYILIILGGLFLMLRKMKPASIMLIIAASLCLITLGMNVIRTAKYSGTGINVAKNIGTSLLFMLSFLFLGIGLCLKRTGALVMCMIAAGCRFIWLFVAYIGATRFTAMMIFAILAALLHITAAVFAGLYLSGKGDEVPVGSYDYGAGNYGDYNTRF